jgi:type II secretory pathway component PulC
LCEKILLVQRMRVNHPFWIVNIFLLSLVLCGSLFVSFSKVRIPALTSIQPELGVRTKKKQEFDINIKKIYENDLFGTFRKETPVYQEPVYQLELPPAPPAQIPIVPKKPEPAFVEPLDITLKGIIVVSDDNDKNRIIIADNKTNRERTFKVGESIDDAQLIRIFNNKIVLLRANGQQEVIYLRQQDAEQDPAYAMLSGWHDVIKPTGPQGFSVNTLLFVERVTNLAQFIDLLNLSTAYQQGMSIGCRIGEIQNSSLGFSLGFSTGDIVIKINATPLTTTENRLKVYNEIIKSNGNQSLRVEFMRKGELYYYTYALVKPEEATMLSDGEKPISHENIQKKKEELLKQKHRFAPSLQDLRAYERDQILEYRKPTQNR